MIHPAPKPPPREKQPARLVRRKRLRPSKRRTGFSSAVFAAAKAETSGCCILCGHRACHGHHCYARGAGGTRNPALNQQWNCAPLCAWCHLEWVEKDRDVRKWLRDLADQRRADGLTWPQVIERGQRRQGTQTAWNAWQAT